MFTVGGLFLQIRLCRSKYSACSSVPHQSHVVIGNSSMFTVGGLFLQVRLCRFKLLSCSFIPHQSQFVVNLSSVPSCPPWRQTLCLTCSFRLYSRLNLLEQWGHSYPPSSPPLRCPECVLQYLHENGCPWDETTCSEAASGGHLECLKYAHENGCPGSLEYMRLFPYVRRVPYAQTDE